MSFRTFYTVNTVRESIETVERFESNNDFLKIWYYPNEDFITTELINIEPEIKHIPMDTVLDIEEHEHRF